MDLKLIYSISLPKLILYVLMFWHQILNINLKPYSNNEKVNLIAIRKLTLIDNNLSFKASSLILSKANNIFSILRIWSIANSLVNHFIFSKLL